MTEKAQVVGIRLRGGLVALLNATDLDLVRAYTWHPLRVGAITYASAQNRRRGAEGPSLIFMHRLIAGVLDPATHVDHWNTNGLDNRRCNLRPTSPSQNCCARRKLSTNTTSRFKGVHREPSGRWHARVKAHGRVIFSAIYETEEEAARAYDREATLAFGRFARTNDDPSAGATPSPKPDYIIEQRDRRRRLTPREPAPRRYKGLHPEQVVEVRSQAAAGRKQCAIAVEFGVSKGCISRIVNRVTWSHVPDMQDALPLER